MSVSDQARARERKQLEGAFAKYDTCMSGLGPQELMSATKRLDVALTQDDVEKGVKEFDKDGDGRLNFEEFLNMMAASSSPVSPLQMAIKAQQLQEELAAAMQQVPSAEWQPFVQTNSTVTIGDVDENFTPKTSLYVTIQPSTQATFASVMERAVSKEPNDDDDDEDQETEKLREHVGVLRVMVRLGDNADEEAVNTVIELLRAAAGEFNAQEESPLFVKFARESKGSHRYLKITAMVRAAEKPLDMAVLAQNQLAGALGTDAAKVFEKIMFGFQLGTDSVEVFSKDSQLPLLALLRQVRLLIYSSMSDSASVAMEWMLLKTRLHRDLLCGSSLERLIPTLLSRAVNAVKVSAHFDEPEQAVRAAVNNVCAFPLQLPVKDEEQRAALKTECEELRVALDTIVQRRIPWNMRAADLLGSKKFDRLQPCGDVRKVALVGLNANNRRCVVQQLAGPQQCDSSSMATNAYLLKHNAKELVLYDVNAVSILPGMNVDSVLVAVDASSTRSVEEGCAFAQRMCKYAHAGEGIILLFNRSAGPMSLEDISALLLSLNLDTKQIEVNNGMIDGEAVNEIFEKLGQDEEHIEEDSETEIYKTLLFALHKVAVSIDDVYYSNTIFDAHVRLVGFPLLNFLPDTPAELAKSRACARGAVRGAKKSLHEMGLELPVLRQMMDEMIKATDGDGDSSSSDSNTNNSGANISDESDN